MSHSQGVEARVLRLAEKAATIDAVDVIVRGIRSGIPIAGGNCSTRPTVSSP